MLKNYTVIFKRNIPDDYPYNKDMVRNSYFGSFSGINDAIYVHHTDDMRYIDKLTLKRAEAIVELFPILDKYHYKAEVLKLNCKYPERDWCSHIKGVGSTMCEFMQCDKKGIWGCVNKEINIIEQML